MSISCLTCINTSWYPHEKRSDGLFAPTHTAQHPQSITSHSVVVLLFLHVFLFAGVSFFQYANTINFRAEFKMWKREYIVINNKEVDSRLSSDACWLLGLCLASSTGCTHIHKGFFATTHSVCTPTHSACCECLHTLKPFPNSSFQHIWHRWCSFKMFSPPPMWSILVWNASARIQVARTQHRAALWINLEKTGRKKMIEFRIRCISIWVLIRFWN